MSSKLENLLLFLAFVAAGMAILFFVAKAVLIGNPFGP